MIPYIHIARFALGGWSVSSFLTLAGLGCLVGCAVAVWRGARAGIPAPRMEELCLWALLAAYLGAHVSPWLYRPESWSILKGAPGMLFSLGISSVGGFAGGLAGIAGFFLRHKVRGAERWRYADAIAFAIPFGGLLGRLGCALNHDHPGLRSGSWLAVRYPDTPRWDLGLLEFFFLVALAVVFLSLGRRPRPAGFFFGWFFLMYGVLRLLLDQLHVDPPRYGGWTVDQYAFTSAACLGGWIVWRQFRRP